MLLKFTPLSWKWQLRAFVSCSTSPAKFSRCTKCFFCNCKCSPVKHSRHVLLGEGQWIIEVIHVVMRVVSQWLTYRCWVACHSTLLEDSHQWLVVFDERRDTVPRLSQRISKTRWNRTTPTSSISAISCSQRRRQSITQVQNHACAKLCTTIHVIQICTSTMKTCLPGISRTDSHSAQWRSRHSRSGPAESPCHLRCGMPAKLQTIVK